MQQELLLSRSGVGQSRSTEQERHQQPGDEASDMGHVGDAAHIRAFVGAGDGPDAAHELGAIHIPRTMTAGMATICRPSNTFTRDCGNIRM